MNADTRPRIEQDFSGWIKRLEHRQEIKKADGTTKKLYGIAFVQNPYGSGRDRSA